MMRCHLQATVTILVIFSCSGAHIRNVCDDNHVNNTKFTFRCQIDNAHDRKVAEFSAEYVTALQINYMDNFKYLTVDFQNNVTISTANKFKYFEKNNPLSLHNIEIILDFNCSQDGKHYFKNKVIITLNVSDVNNRNSVIDKDRYKDCFQVAAPEHPELTQFGRIGANDDDFANDKTEFDEIKSKDKSKDQYMASLKLLKNVSAPFEQDGGSLEKSTKAAVAVTAAFKEERNLDRVDAGDKNITSHPPVFSRYVYLAEYTTSRELKLERSVTLKHASAENTKLSQSDYSKYVTVKLNSSNSEEVGVQLQKKFSDKMLKNSFLVLEIEATNRNISIPGRTVLIIKLPLYTDPDDYSPVFSRHVYFANYTSELKLKMEEPIKIHHEERKHINVQQFGYSKYVKISEKIEKDESVEVKMVQTFPPEISLEKFVVIELIAKNKKSDVAAYALFIIRFINTDEDQNIIPQVFSSNLYFANYSTSKGLKLNQPITLKHNNDTPIKINQLGDQTYIKVYQNDFNKNQVDVALLKNIPKEIFVNNLITIGIEAKTQGLNIFAQTSLIVSLLNDDVKENDVHPPVFSKHMYVANYSVNEGLQLTEKVNLKYGVTNSTNFKHNGYNEFFKITQNNVNKGEVDISLVKAIPTTVFEDNLIMLDIEARNDGLNISGHTLLIIKLQNNIHPPVFSRHFYLAKYSAIKGLKLEEDVYIRFGSTTDMIIRQNGYEEYFSVSQNPINKSKIDVRLQQKIPSQFFGDGLITLEIEAENKGLNISRRAILVISLLSKEEVPSVVRIWNFTLTESVFSLILLPIFMVIIVFVNTIILFLFFKKSSVTHGVVNGVTKTSTHV